MKEVKTLLKFMKGNIIAYLIGMIFVIIAQFFAILAPLVIRTTIDSIIGDELITSQIVVKAVEVFGGKYFLRENLWIIGILIIAVAVLRGIFMFLKSFLSSKSAENTIKALRDALYDHIQKLPYGFHVKADTGDLVQRCTSDIETIRRFLGIQLVEVSGSLFMISFVLYVMLKLNTKLALVSVITLPILFTFAYLFFTKVKKIYQEVDEAEAAISTVLQENLTGVRVVKAFARQKYELVKFDEKNRDYTDKAYNLMKILAIYWGCSDFICYMQIGLLLLFGSILALKGQISLGIFIAFTTYINMLIWPTRQLGRILTDMGKAIVSIRRINQILDEPIEILEENHLKPVIKGSISFEHVYFEYEENKPVLEDITFTVKPGETVAIIGPTGSGKSSLIHLLARLYEYTKGSIKIDGIELKCIDKAWIRKNVGIVQQEPFLFAKTIRENIKLANPTIDDVRMYEAAKIANIDKDILYFDKGYDTLIGERGVSLSGGQKQRMTIARIIINQCPIVVFDDSLSAVDTETDLSIRRELKNRKNKSTTIIISHRISTVSEADLIIVLDNGKIVQRGNHKSLLKEEGLYKRIYQIQNPIDHI
ncbi:MAG: ABC transporter ATP-binding protein [Tissierellia bacterium]|nr:ABC transporter ATP-binding protein [Tissierellia bacterium]